MPFPVVAQSQLRDPAVRESFVIRSRAISYGTLRTVGTGIEIDYAFATSMTQVPMDRFETMSA
jgi:hypothetical protein